MKTIYLLRHAKSSWKDVNLADHERPLTERGRSTAKAIAAYMKRERIELDMVLCSTAVRAKQTLEPLAKRLKPAKVVFESGIYEVPQRLLWKYLRDLPKKADTLLLIGHNPGLHHFALALADPDSADRLPTPEGKFPTGAFATFSFEGKWKDLRPHRAHLVSFVRPRELAAEEKRKPAKRR